MKSFVCQILKGLFVTGWLCTSPVQVEAAGCTGASAVTSASTLQNCLNNVNAGETIEIKGIESGITTPYRSDMFQINSRNVACGSQITIQPFGYTGPGTGDTVFFDGGNSSANAWTRCQFVSNACQSP